MCVCGGGRDGKGKEVEEGGDKSGDGPCASRSPPLPHKLSDAQIKGHLLFLLLSIDHLTFLSSTPVWFIKHNFLFKFKAHHIKPHSSSHFL